MKFEPISKELENIATKIVDAAYKRLGFIINFNVTRIKGGIKRMI